jgi:hypothetical protein
VEVAAALSGAVPGLWAVRDLEAEAEGVGVTIWAALIRHLIDHGDTWTPRERAAFVALFAAWVEYAYPGRPKGQA